MNGKDNCINNKKNEEFFFSCCRREKKNINHHLYSIFLLFLHKSLFSREQSKHTHAVIVLVRKNVKKTGNLQIANCRDMVSTQYILPP